MTKKYFISYAYSTTRFAGFLVSNIIVETKKTIDSEETIIGIEDKIRDKTNKFNDITSIRIINFKLIGGY